MKDKDKNLEQNISRLVKQVGDSDTPNKAFTNSLIDEALGELKKQPVGRERDRRSTVMKVTKIFAYAAAIIIVGGILLTLMVQTQSGGLSKDYFKVTQAVKTKDES